MQPESETSYQDGTISEEEVKHKSSRKITTAALATLIAAASYFVLGYTNAATNATLRPMSAALQWCEGQKEDWMLEFESCPAYATCRKNDVYIPFVTASAQLGGVIGCWFSAALSGKGRRFGLMVAFATSLVGLLLNSLAVDVYMVVGGRLIIGLVCGVFSFIAPQYVNEIAPPRHRGFYAGFVDTQLVTGGLVATAFGLAFDGTPKYPADYTVECGAPGSSYDLDLCQDDFTDGEYFCSVQLSNFDYYWWRLVMSGFLLPISIIALVLLLFVFKFETPYWLLLKKKPEDAENVLMTLRNTKHKKHVDSELKETIEVLDDFQSEQQGFMDFNKEPRARYAIWTAIMLATLNVLSGVVPMSFLSVVLFMEAGVSESKAAVLSVLIIVVQLVVTLILMILADKMGRKPLMIVGTTIQSIAVTVPAIALLVAPTSPITMRLALAGSVLFIVGFSLGLNGLTITYIFEMFPSHMRYNGQKIAMTCNWLSVLLEFAITPLMTNTQIFVKSAFFSIITVIICIFMVRETKGLPVGSSPYFMKLTGSESNSSSCATVPETPTDGSMTPNKEKDIGLGGFRDTEALESDSDITLDSEH